MEELRFYVMVSVQYAPLGVADDNVYPWQDFPDTPFVVRNDGMMGGCHPVLFKGGIAAEPVRGHIGIPVRSLPNLADNGGSLEIVDDLHLYIYARHSLAYCTSWPEASLAGCFPP